MKRILINLRIQPLDRRRIGLGLCLLFAGLTLAAIALAVQAPVAVRAAESEPGEGETEPCANGTVIAEPAAHPQLVADCALLLGLMNQLRGTAALNWSASQPISSWTGVSVGGDPQRVTSAATQPLAARRPACRPHSANSTRLSRLDLYRNRLTGPIPAQLGDAGPSLQVLNLSDNRL